MTSEDIKKLGTIDLSDTVQMRSIKIKCVEAGIEFPFRKIGGRYYKKTVKFDYTDDEIEMFLNIKDPLMFVDECFPNLHGHQREHIDDLDTYRYNAVCHSKQMGVGKATLVSVLHFILNKLDKTVLYTDEKGVISKENMTTFMEMLDELPFYLQPGIKRVNRKEGSIYFDNGCRILFKPVTKHAAIGFTIDYLVVQNFAHIPANRIELFYKSIYPTIACMRDSKVVITSVPNGMNLFHKLMNDDNNYYHKKRIHWSVIPRTDNWKEDKIKEVGKFRFMQDYDLKFRDAKEWMREEKLDSLLI